MKSKNSIFVVKKEDRWATRMEGADRVSKKFDTLKEAIASRREQAKKNQLKLIIKGKDGKFREKYSYGNDPKNTKC